MLILDIFVLWMSEFLVDFHIHYSVVDEKNSQITMIIVLIQHVRDDLTITRLESKTNIFYKYKHKTSHNLKTYSLKHIFYI